MSTSGNGLFLSVVVTVYTESISVIETIDRLQRSDQGGMREIIIVVSPRASRETMTICEDLAAKHPMVRLHIQQHVPGVGWALREGMAMATQECVAIMSGDLETEPEAV